MVSTRDDGSYYMGVCEGSHKPACKHDLARTFASCINKICKLKKTPKTFRHLVSLDTPEWAIIRGLTLAPLNYNWWFIIIVSGLKSNQFSHTDKVWKKCKPTLPQNFHNISIPENEMQQPQLHTKDKRLPGMLTYIVSHSKSCFLRFRWLHE